MVLEVVFSWSFSDGPIKGGGNRRGRPFCLVTDGRLQSGIRGLAPHDGAFRQGSITEWRSYLSAILEPLDLRPPVRVAALTGSAGDVEPNLAVCPAPVAERLHAVTERHG